MIRALNLLRRSASAQRTTSALNPLANASRSLSLVAPDGSPLVPPNLPKEARVVVIGAGVIGTSIAYHLGHLGWKNVVLLDQNKITSGTTWHAAGLMVRFGSKSETSTEIRKYSRDLYANLEKETGLSTGFKPVGFIELATDKDRLEEYRRVSDFNRKCGVDVQEISPAEVKKLFPLCRVDDIEAGFYVEGDGRVNPVDLTMSLAKGARMQGVSIFEDVPVIDVLDDGVKVTGVKTAYGDIKAEYVVNCAGMWARQLGERSGVNIPNQAAEHYYMITDAMPEVDPNWPVIEDPSSYCYIRPEGGGMMVGLFETKAAAWNVKKIPTDFTFGEIAPDWERMSPYLEKAMNRVPSTMKAGIKKFFCGPESFTPDLAPIVGEAPELKNYFVCAGLNSIGIISGGGIGRIMANWIVNGKPDVDVTGFNIDRLHRFQNTPMYRSHRVTEAVGLVYKCHYPTYQYQTARGAKRSPIHAKLEAKNAFFKDVSGWEGADFYAPAGVKPELGKLSWGKHSWFPFWAEEHKAVRENVGLIDMSFMSKFLVQGRDAGKMLNYLSTADVDGDAGRITYTQWLNRDGKVEADLTVSKLTNSKFMVVATDTAHRHAENHMLKYIRDNPDINATVTDVTGAYAQINIQGPNSRKLMSMLTETDMSDANLPYRGVLDIPIGFARVICVRITYVGELGYELYVPAEQAVHVYEHITKIGEQVGLRHCGLKALGSLRMEKGYRDYGHDIDNTDTLIEVGLGFTADYKKAGGFLGKEHVEAQKKKGIAGLRQRLVQVLVVDNPDVMMYHAEVVFKDGKPMGYVRSASYAHTLGGACGLAMIESDVTINNDYVEKGNWEIQVAGKKYPAKVSIRPMYDPDNLKIKA